MSNYLHQRKLFAYSALAASLLFLKDELVAQAVYTDIDPDTILDVHLEKYFLDMDNDGAGDFHFFNVSYTTYTIIGTHYTYKEKIWAGVLETYANGMAGSNADWGSAGIRYYPYALSEGNTINSLLDFNEKLYQRMAFKSHWTSFHSSHTFFQVRTGGNWFPAVEDRYLGVFFKASDERMHYGWIRCSVEDSGRTFIIKDYAYESKHDIGITAGDTVGSALIYIDISDAGSLTPVIYSFGKTVHINFAEPHAEQMRVNIYDVTGDLVFTNKITAQQSAFALTTLNAGFYLVELLSANHRFIQKVFIE